jgi:hypothetical protein
MGVPLDMSRNRPESPERSDQLIVADLTLRQEPDEDEDEEDDQDDNKKSDGDEDEGYSE